MNFNKNFILDVLTLLEFARSQFFHSGFSLVSSILLLFHFLIASNAIRSASKHKIITKFHLYSRSDP